MKKIGVVLVSVLLLLVVATGCSKDPLVGRWENSDMESFYVFESNGEGMIGFFGIELEFEYEINEDSVTMTLVGEEAEEMAADGQNLTDIIVYEIKDDQLHIMGTVFTRAE